MSYHFYYREIYGLYSYNFLLCNWVRIVPRDEYNVTTYSCCVNADKGVFYYKTYHNSQITAVDMQHEDLDSSELKEFPLVTEQQVAWLN